MSFQKQLINALNKRVGNYKEYPLQELMVLTNLKGVVSDETLRRILINDTNVREGTKDLIISTLEGRVAGMVESRPGAGKDTILEIQKLIESHSQLFSTEIIFENELQVNFTRSNFRQIIKVIDDSGDKKNIEATIDDAGPAELDRYFNRHINVARQAIKEDKCDSFLILTHIDPGVQNKKLRDEQKDKADLKIEIETVLSFKKRYFKTEHYEKFLEDQLNHTREFFEIPVKAFKAQSEALQETSLQDELNEFLGGKENLVLLLGHHGTGKSVGCSICALNMIREANKAGEIFPLPIILNASNFPSLNTSGVTGIIHEQLEVCYNTTLPRSLVEDLVKTGKIVVFIDALDESKSLINWSIARSFIMQLPFLAEGGDAGPKYIVTTRQELFDTQKIEDQVFQDIVPIKLELQPWSPQQAKEYFEKRVPSMNLKSGQMLKPFLDLIRTPLFLGLVSDVFQLGWKPLAKPGSIKTIADARAVSDAFKEYSRRWAEREQIRSISTEITPSIPERLWFCELLAGISWDDAFEKNSLDIPSLKLATKQQYRNSTGSELNESSSEFDLLLYNAKLSSLLRRVGDGFMFPSESFRLFFLAANFTKELVKRGSKFKILKKRRIASDEFDLVALFTLGGFDPTADEFRTPQKVIDFLVAIIEERSFAPYCESFDELSNMYYNLIGMILWIIKLGDLQVEEITLSKAYLPFVGPEAFGLAEGELKVKIHIESGNLEYVSSPYIVAKNNSLTTQPPPAVQKDKNLKKEAIAKLKAFCLENRMIGDKGADVSKKGKEIDLKWIAVPSGTYSVNQWKAASPEEYQQSGQSDIIRRGLKSEKTAQETQIITNSFLIMQNPVTNGQFLHFILHNEDWAPQAYRDKIGNRWYLLGFNKLESYDRNGSSIPDYIELIKNSEPEWFSAPVVSVTWEAATAFANYYDCRLPTETQYEVSARMFQDELGAFPWEHDDKDKWFISYDPQKAQRKNDQIKKSEEKTEKAEFIPSYVPMFDCTKVNPGENYDLSAFEAWVNKNNIEVPYHLIGGISEWTSCQWDPCWPIPLQHYGDIALAPHNNGLAYTDNKPTRILSEPRNPEKGYSQRGTSYVMSLDIFSRSVQPLSNANEDVGFRCVKPIY